MGCDRPGRIVRGKHFDGTRYQSVLEDLEDLKGTGNHGEDERKLNPSRWS